MAGAAFAASDPAALDTAGEVINEKWALIGGIKQRIESRWEDEIKPQWDGDSAMKYGQKVYQFTHLIQVQLDALAEIGELMGQSANNYRMQNADVDAAVDEIAAEID